MRVVLLTAVILSSACMAHAKDPTVPGGWLNPPASSPTPDKAAPLLDLRLKAMVMQDQDHGSAIVMAGERRVLIRLNRNQPTRFTLQTQQFEVIDFDAKSLQVKSIAGTQVVN